MPRKPRILVDGGIYHVFSRVTRREPVFDDDGAADVFLDQLAKIKKRDGFVLFAWVLMSNHYHLLVRTVEVPLPRTMASLQVGFSKRFNRYHGLIGPFWQGRYKAILVEDQRYFDQLLAYVHLNPVAAGVVTDPDRYQYSGHQELMGSSRRGLVDVDEVLTIFGGSRGPARRRYVAAIKGFRDEQWIGESPGSLPWWQRSGTGEYENDEVSSRADLPFIDELGRSTGIERPRIDVATLVDLACVLTRIDREVLKGPSRERQVVRGREVIALVGFELYSIRLKEIAAELGKSQDTASRWVSRAAKRRGEDQGFAELVDRLDRCVVSSGGVLS